MRSTTEKKNGNTSEAGRVAFRGGGGGVFWSARVRDCAVRHQLLPQCPDVHVAHAGGQQHQVVGHVEGRVAVAGGGVG